MEFTRFNVFQRIMRLWDSVCPYNAAQVLELQGEPDLQQLSDAWHRAMNGMGLGQVCVRRDRFRHEILPDPASRSPLDVAPPGVSLEQYISQEMNRPFEPFDAAADSVTFSPFRPFIVRARGTYYAGVIYHHWVADSVSIRMVLREWFYQRHDPARACTTPVQIPSGGYWHFFGPEAGRWSLFDGILSALRLTTRFGTARKIDEQPPDYRVRCSIHPLPDGMVHGLRDAARSHRVTLNDVFLAAIAEACHRFGPNRMSRDRSELALGTIVDLRPSSSQDLGNIFGLFLGFTTVIVRPQTLGDWPALVRTIGHQNTVQKQRKAAQASQIRMAAAVGESLILSPETWVRFYLRHLPLAAGISNVNMNRSWAAPYHPSLILDYLRFSPTGPTLPVVFTPSSIGGRSHVAVTTRTALIDDATATRTADCFIQRLKAVAGSSQHLALSSVA